MRLSGECRVGQSQHPLFAAAQVLAHHGFRVLRVDALDRFGHGEVANDRVAHTVVAAEMNVAQLNAEGLDVQIDDQFGQPRVVSDGQDRLVEARSFIDLLGGSATAVVLDQGFRMPPTA